MPSAFRNARTRPGRCKYCSAYRGKRSDQSQLHRNIWAEPFRLTTSMIRSGQSPFRKAVCTALRLPLDTQRASKDTLASACDTHTFPVSGLARNVLESLLALLAAAMGYVQRLCGTNLGVERLSPSALNVDRSSIKILLSIARRTTSEHCSEMSIRLGGSMSKSNFSEPLKR